MVKLRLFVWNDYCTDYSSGLAFAIARDEKEARKLIEKERGMPVYLWGDLSVYPLTERHAEEVSGGV